MDILLFCSRGIMKHKFTMAGEEPPYLTVGTDVSAKYRGAFCEAKIKKVSRSVKCKVTFKDNSGTAIVTDDVIKGTLRVGVTVEAKHPDTGLYSESIINKLTDCSLYTVVFDDGDEKTLRRTALCLKGARHFAESETLDQLPLTNPEHFGTPVIGSGKKQRKRRSYDDDTSDEERPAKKKVSKEKEKDKDIGKVVCVDLGDKRKKDKWFPALVVSPSAQEGSKTKSKEEYLVRSFKDGKYHTPSKKETKDFTREVALRVDNSSLKTAVEKALIYLDKDELPPHWDRDLLMGNDTSDDDSEEDSDSDSSDDEPSEEKDRFVAQLYKFMDDRGTPINKAPAIGARDLNLYKLFKTVQKMGGYNKVTNQMQWKSVYTKMGLPGYNTASSHSIKSAYKKYLHSFEDFYRKLGISMGTSSRPGRGRISSGRSLAYARDMNREFKVIHDRAKLKEKEKEKEKDMEKDNEKEKEKERDEEKDLPANKSKDEEKRNFKSKDKDDEKSKNTSRDDKGKNKDRNHLPTALTTPDFNHNTAEKEESKDTKLSKRRTNMRSFTGRKYTKEEKKETDDGKKEKSKNDEDKDLKKESKEVEMKLDKKDDIKDKKETDKKDKKQADKKDKLGDKKNKKDADKDRKETVKRESDKDKKIDQKLKKMEKKIIEKKEKDIDKKEIEIKDKKEIDKKDKKDIEKKEVGKKDSDKKELGKKEIDKKDKKDIEKKEIDKKDKKEPIRKEFEKKDKKETPKKELEKKDKKETPKKEIEKKETPKKEIEKKDKKDSPKKEIEKKDRKETPKKEFEKKDKKETEKKVIEKKDKKERKVEKKEKKFEKKEIEKKGKKEMVKKEIGKKKIDKDKETENYEIKKKEIEKESEKKVNNESGKTEIDKETKNNENGKEIEQKEIETTDMKLSDKIEIEKLDEKENEKKEIVKKETEKKEIEKKAKREVEKKDKETEKKSMKEIEKREIENLLKEMEKKSLKETEKKEIEKNEIEKKDIKETEKKLNETKELENKEIENRKHEKEKKIEEKESESKELDKIDEKKEEREMIVLKDLEKEDFKNDKDVDKKPVEKKSDGEKGDVKKDEYKDNKDVTKELDSDTDEASASDNEKESGSDASSDDDSDDDEFVVGSKVKVKYGRGRQQKIYEAKILEIEEQNGDVHFLVHYTGWNTRYDEWVRRQRVIECVDDKGSSRKRKKTSKTTSNNKTAIKRGRPTSTTSKSFSNNQISQGSSTSGPSKTKTSPIPQPVKSRTTRSDRNSLQDLPFVNGLDNKCPTARTRNRKSSGYTESSNDQSRISDSDGNEDSDASELELMDQIQQESPELEISNSQKINKEEKIVPAEEEEKTMPALVSSEIKEKETKIETKMDNDKPEMELKIEEETISKNVEQKEEPKTELEKPTLTVSEVEIKFNFEEPKEDIKEVKYDEPLQEENSQNSIELLSPPVLIEEPVVETNFVPEPFFEETAPAEELCTIDEGYKESLIFSVEDVVKELQVVKQKMEIEQTVLRVLEEITRTKEKEEAEEERTSIDFKKEENVRQDIKIIETNLKENVEAPVEKRTSEVNEPNQSLNYELENTSKLELPQFNDISFLEAIPLLSVQEKVEKTDKLENIDIFPKHEIFKFQREKKSFLFRESKREKRKLLEMKRDSLYDFTDDSSLEGTDSDLESMEISESTSSIINKLEKDEEEAMALLTSNIFKEIPEMVERNNDYRFKYEKPKEDKDELDQDKKKVKRKLIRDKKSPCEERISPSYYKDCCEERISPFEELQIDLKLEDKPSSSLFKLDKGGTKEKDKKKIKDIFHKQETEICIIDSTQVEKGLDTSQNPVLQHEPAVLCLSSASSPKSSNQLETAPSITQNILNIPCSSHNNNSSCHIPPPPTISLRHNSEASAVLDNTPPTTPESTAHSASPSRESPSPQKDDDSNKSDKDSCDALPNILKVESAEDMSQADSAGTSSDTSVPSLEIIPGSIKRRRETEDQTPSIKKRKKTHHRKSSTDASKISNICCGNNPSSSGSSLVISNSSSSSIIIPRQRHQSGKTGSDSDEMPSILESSANTDSSNNGSATNKEPLRQRSPRPSKFNFCIDPSLEGAERIAVLQDKLSELRKIYMSLKAEVACIDRRRKRAKRKEREAAAAASTTMEVQCA